MLSGQEYEGYMEVLNTNAISRYNLCLCIRIILWVVLREKGSMHIVGLDLYVCD